MRAARLAITTLVLILLGTSVSRGELAPALTQALAREKFVYISSTRKDGTLGKPAEIWFMWHEGAVYVATRPDSWRVKRIKWKRPQAKIWVGKPDGPSFVASGEISNDAEAQRRLLEVYAQKYAEGWAKWEKSFREGFKDGGRVLVKYTPLPSPPGTASR